MIIDQGLMSSPRIVNRKHQLPQSSGEYPWESLQFLASPSGRWKNSFFLAERREHPHPQETVSPPNRQVGKELACISCSSPETILSNLLRDSDGGRTNSLKHGLLQIPGGPQLHQSPHHLDAFYLGLFAESINNLVLVPNFPNWKFYSGQILWYLCANRSF